MGGGVHLQAEEGGASEEDQLRDGGRVWVWWLEPGAPTLSLGRGRSGSGEALGLAHCPGPGVSGDPGVSGGPGVGARRDWVHGGWALLLCQG